LLLLGRLCSATDIEELATEKTDTVSTRSHSTLNILNATRIGIDLNRLASVRHTLMRHSALQLSLTLRLSHLLTIESQSGLVRLNDNATLRAVNNNGLTRSNLPHSLANAHHSCKRVVTGNDTYMAGSATQSGHKAPNGVEVKLRHIRREELPIDHNIALLHPLKRVFNATQKVSLYAGKDIPHIVLTRTKVLVVYSLKHRHNLLASASDSLKSIHTLSDTLSHSLGNHRVVNHLKVGLKDIVPTSQRLNLLSTLSQSLIKALKGATVTSLNSTRSNPTLYNKGATYSHTM
jgi:hypothetical protein